MIEEDSINSMLSADDEEVVSTKTMETLSIRSVGIEEWAAECFNLHTLTSQSMPRVGRLAEEKPSSVHKKLESCLNCPILLHSASSKTIVKSRVLQKKKGGEFTSVGPTLIIPENYDGLFAILPESGRNPSYSTISDIAAVMPKRFFTCTKMVAMSIVTSDKGSDKYVQRSIPEASVLKVDDVFTAKWKTEAETGIFKKSKMTYTTPEIKYLKCTDSKRKTVYIEYTTQGKFYTMFDKDVSDQYALYRIRDLWRFFDFPLNVRLIYGTSPIEDVKFTNFLCLSNKEEMKSIITSTIGHKINMMFDIPVTTSVFVNLPVAEDSALETDTVKTAIEFANKYEASFNRRIKRSLFKIDEMTDDEDEEDDDEIISARKKSRQMLKAKSLKSGDKAENSASEIPLDLLKDVKLETAKSKLNESNDWDDNSVKELQDLGDMSISGRKIQQKEKNLIFEDVDLENVTII